VVEVDGPSHYGRERRDRIRDNKFREDLGLPTIRITNSEIERDAGRAARKILYNHTVLQLYAVCQTRHDVYDDSLERVLLPLEKQPREFSWLPKTFSILRLGRRCCSD